MVKFKQPKTKDVQDTKAYKQGYKDADTLLRQYSLWFVLCSGAYTGLKRKDKTHSNVKLFRYCEGFNDRIQKALDKKGMGDIKDYQETIGS